MFGVCIRQIASIFNFRLSQRFKYTIKKYINFSNLNEMVIVNMKVYIIITASINNNSNCEDRIIEHM